MENNYEQTSDFATVIIDGFAITSNSQSDIDLINQFVSDHEQDLQDSLSAIQESIIKAELNVQWNDLHGEKVLEWLIENYGQKDTTTAAATTTTAKDDHSAVAAILFCKSLLITVIISLFL